MDLFERRQLIKTLDNPNKALDYIITLKQSIPAQELELTVRYIPDKLIIEKTAFTTYVAELLTRESSSLEAIASTLLEDLNNELVCRWLQVDCSQSLQNETSHCVLLEDKQPQWENTALLQRMSKI